MRRRVAGEFADSALLKTFGASGMVATSPNIGALAWIAEFGWPTLLGMGKFALGGAEKRLERGSGWNVEGVVFSEVLTHKTLLF